MPNKEKVFTLINKLPIFANLSDKDIKKIANMEWKYEILKKRKFLFEEGSPNLWIHFVLEGRVKLLAHSPSGKDVILKISSKNDLLTDNSVLFDDEREYLYSAQALEESAIIKIEKKEFLEILNIFPNVTLDYLKQTEKYLKESYMVLKDMALEKVERRIAINILRLASETGVLIDEGIKLQIKLSRQEMANLTGTTIETAIRIMSKLKKDKYIDEIEGHIVIVRKHDLSLLAMDF